jgi:hypothetical protein
MAHCCADGGNSAASACAISPDRSAIHSSANGSSERAATPADAVKALDTELDAGGELVEAALHVDFDELDRMRGVQSNKYVQIVTRALRGRHR